MATQVQVVYEDGVFKPRTPVRIREHAELTVVIPSEAELPGETAAVDDPWGAIDRLVGCLQSGRGDVAENHDAYLYGEPPA